LTGIDPTALASLSPGRSDDRAGAAASGLGYLVSGLVTGLLAFAPAAWLAWFMLGCWSRSGSCEITTTALVAMVVALAVLLIPIVGGSVSASRSESPPLDIAGTAAFAIVAVEWILVFA